MCKKLIFLGLCIKYPPNIHCLLYKVSFLKVNTSTKCDLFLYACAFFVYVSSSVFLLRLNCC